MGGGGGAGVTFYHESKFKVKKNFPGGGGGRMVGRGKLSGGSNK